MTLNKRFNGSGFRVQRFRVQPSRWPWSGQSNQKRNYIFVKNDVVSYKRFRV
jgi:hypothetical protein